MKITVIGAGNIGGATARGLVAKKVLDPSDLTLTTSRYSTLEKYYPLGCMLTTDNLKAVEGADIVILALKPAKVAEIARTLSGSLDYSKQIIVSMAAGVEDEAMLDALRKQDGSEPEFAVVIPNTAIEIGESVNFISPVSLSDSSLACLKDIFGKLGHVEVVDRKLLPAGTALASCGIAHAMRYARAASEGGVELGFEADDALKIVEQTVIGAMKLLQAHGSHPEAEIDKVTTPGGITIKGLNAMEKAGFSSAVIEGLKASKK